MRYDPMLTTALSLAADTPAARIAMWRQLVDIFAQADGAISVSVRAAGLERIAALSSVVPVAARRAMARQAAARLRHIDAVALYANDEPVVAAPVMLSARLSADDWLALLPTLPSPSRALLRQRRDLPDAVMRALNVYGASDFAIAHDGAAAGQTGTQIRDLVARIEAFRLQAASTIEHPAPVARAVGEFSFETDANGLIDWVSVASREAVIGTDIATIADPAGYGVDGQAAGAVRRRAPFRDARMRIAGTGPIGGDWRISGAPLFNPRDGRFAGYQGAARRPRIDEDAGLSGGGATLLPADSMRQLTHELRTPLNAVIGFAEMIDRQLLGPVAAEYRRQALHIVEDGQQLLAIVDDIDLLARAGSSDHPDIVDIGTVVSAASEALRPVLAGRPIRLEKSSDAPFELLGIDRTMLERTLIRLIAAVAALVDNDEHVDVALRQTSAQQIGIAVSRPRALIGTSDHLLYDPASAPDMPYPGAPQLSLGFTLRLVGQFAREIGGYLLITADEFIVMLPRANLRADLPAGTR